MFNRILLPMDRSPLAECVLPHTVAVAHAFNSQVTLVHVMDPPHRPNWARAVDPLNWRIRKAETESYLGDLALRLQRAGVRTEKQVLEGRAADRVVEFSRKNDVPLILLSSHGQSGLSGWNVSSVVQKVMLRTGCASRLLHPTLGISDLLGFTGNMRTIRLTGQYRQVAITKHIA